MLWSLSFSSCGGNGCNRPTPATLSLFSLSRPQHRPILGADGPACSAKFCPPRLGSPAPFPAARDALAPGSVPGKSSRKSAEDSRVRGSRVVPRGRGAGSGWKHPFGPQTSSSAGRSRVGPHSRRAGPGGVALWVQATPSPSNSRPSHSASALAGAHTHTCAHMCTPSRAAALTTQARGRGCRPTPLPLAERPLG